MATMTFHSSYNMNAPVEGGDMDLIFNTGGDALISDGNIGFYLLGSGLTYNTSNGFTAGTVTNVYLGSSTTGNLIFFFGWDQ